jgi:hypothetical protein
MLAQAVECYFLKAEYGKLKIDNALPTNARNIDSASSPVTSRIAAQTADYYDMSYKSAIQVNSFKRTRFPKVSIRESTRDFAADIDRSGQL